MASIIDRVGPFKPGKHLKNMPQPLLKSLVAGDVIPVVGAGFSRNGDGPDGFQMPDWNALGKAVAEELPEYAYDNNPIEAISIYETRFKRPELVAALRRIMRICEVYPGAAHRLFVQCFRNVICTTNIDMLLEAALTESRVRHVVVTSEDGLSTLNSDGVSLVKIHGDLNHPEKMVLTEDDYDLFVSKNPLLCTFISSLFITKTMLLIGYSLDDADMRQLLRIVQSRLGKMSRPVYCIQVDASNEVVAKFERRGVNVINLRSARGQTYKETMVEFFRQLHDYLDNAFQRRVSSSEEDSKEQLMLSREDNNLCFVAASKNRIAYLRKILNPIITESGAVPLWPDNVQVKDGMDYRAAMYAAARRSRMRIFDVSEFDGNIEALLQESLREDAESTILISEDSGVSSDKILAGGYNVIPYIVDEEDGSGDYRDSNSRFIEALRSFLCKKYAVEKTGVLEGAKRLFKSGEYDAAVVSAWTELEAYVRREYPYKNSTSFIARLNDLIDGESQLRHDLIQVRRLRNEVVHGVVMAREKDAKRAIDVVSKFLSRHQI